MLKPIHLLGISGSLRQGSYNTALLRTAAGMLPEGMSLELADLASLPIFNADQEKPFPEAVALFRRQVGEADALLIATPEYNSSLSGALKNAIDWASRSPAAPLTNKPVGMIGASTGNFGSVRAQLHLRQVLTHVGALPLGKPEVLVARAESVFDAQGNLTDATARRFLGEFLVALADWVRRLSAA